jgi:hypothetical protein
MIAVAHDTKNTGPRKEAAPLEGEGPLSHAAPMGFWPAAVACQQGKEGGLKIRCGDQQQAKAEGSRLKRSRKRKKPRTRSVGPGLRVPLWGNLSMGRETHRPETYHLRAYLDLAFCHRVKCKPDFRQPDLRSMSHGRSRSFHTAQLCLATCQCPRVSECPPFKSSHRSLVPTS